jgi:hypothetical protein
MQEEESKFLKVGRAVLNILCVPFLIIIVIPSLIEIGLWELKDWSTRKRGTRCG